MTSHSHSAKFRTGELGGWVGTAGIVAAAGLGGWIFIQALINGPEARAMMERQRSAEIAQEDQDYCGKLGMGSGTQMFRPCADVLAQIRRNHEERTQRDYGML